MSKIDEHIQKLRELESKLKLEKLKIEFLHHILESAKDYNHAAFAEVKNDVASMLEAFVRSSIESIESGGAEKVPSAKSVNAPEVVNAPPLTKNKGEEAVGANEKLSFALDNRHLGGKNVMIANDKNISVKGKVVGLDAPYVIVATETGPTIRVPLDRVSLI